MASKWPSSPTNVIPTSKAMGCTGTASRSSGAEAGTPRLATTSFCVLVMLPTGNRPGTSSSGRPGAFKHARTQRVGLGFAQTSGGASVRGKRLGVAAVEKAARMAR